MLIDQTHHSKQYYYFDQRIKDCINFIQSNYTYKIKMHDLCKISCISSSETIKLFKRYVGMTPFQYLLHYRLEKGAKQLKLTHNNVTEVAMDCGFLQRVISYRCLKINTKLHLNNFNYHINKMRILLSIYLITGIRILCLMVIILSVIRIYIFVVRSCERV